MKIWQPHALKNPLYWGMIDNKSLCIFNVYRLMYLEISTCTWNHHHSLWRIYIHHLQKFSLILFIIIITKKNTRWNLQMANKYMSVIIREMQIQWEVSSHHLEWLLMKKEKRKRDKCCEGVEKSEPSCTIDWNVYWYSQYGKKYGVFLKKSKTELLDQSHFCVFIQRNWNMPDEIPGH